MALKRDFSSLPLEVIEHITSYLSTKDLLSCSLVSIDWRAVLNNDILWINRCEGGYSSKSFVKRLQNHKAHVEPLFSLPQDSKGLLEPLCNWRVNCMTLNHFMQNVKRKRTKRYDVVGNFNTNFKAYYEAEKIIILFKGLDSFEIWNTEDEPYCEDVISCESGISPFVYVYKKYILVLQFNLLRIYQKTNGHYELLHIRLFDQNKTSSQDVPTFPGAWAIPICFTKTVSANCLRCVCFQNLFIGHNWSSDLKRGIFHIWDIEHGIKLKEEKFISLNNIIDVDFYKTTELVYMVLESSTNNEIQFTIVSYNPIIKTYTDFCVDINGSKNERYFFFDSNYVVLLRSNVIDIFDTTKGDKGKEVIRLNTCPFPFAFVVHNSKIIYTASDISVHYLHVIDIKTLSSSHVIALSCPINKLIISNANLLLLEYNIADYYNYSSDIDEYELSVWNLEPIMKINSLKLSNRFSGSLNFTKLISVQPKMFSVIHFW